jgi:hypothetical protein
MRRIYQLGPPKSKEYRGARLFGRCGEGRFSNRDCRPSRSAGVLEPEEGAGYVFFNGSRLGADHGFEQGIEWYSYVKMRSGTIMVLKRVSYIVYTRISNYYHVHDGNRVSNRLCCQLFV